MAAMPAELPAQSRALRPAPLVPYAIAYKGRIAAALVALVVASAATLVMPIALRRVVDFGFSSEDRASSMPISPCCSLVVGVLALASAARYYLVITLGERVVADLRAAVFRHLTPLDPAFFDQTKSGEIVSRLTADTTQVKAAFGVSISIALRNALPVPGRGGADGRDEPEALGSRAARHPRSSCCRW